MRVPGAAIPRFALADPTAREVLSLERVEERQVLARIEALLLATNAWDATGLGIDYGLADRVPGILHRLWASGRITDARLHGLLSEVWVTNEQPLACLGVRAWVSMFRTTGYFCRTQTTNGATNPFPMDTHLEDRTRPITVWRGAVESTGGRGLSWSSYRDCALAFAHVRADCWGDAVLYRATVPSRAVLAQFVGREQEIVVNPDFLRGRIAVDVRVAPSAESLRSRRALRDRVVL